MPVSNYERQIMELSQLDSDDAPVVITNWMPTTGTLWIGVSGAGIRSVAATVKHEMRHREMFLSHPENASHLSGIEGDVVVRFDDEDPEDEDLDGVWSIDEISGRWEILTNEQDTDTYRLNSLFDGDPYGSYGDNEIRARLAERQDLESAYHAEHDWCNPGCQSHIRRGPTRDESAGGASR